MIKLLLKNPFTLWLRWLVRATLLMFKYRNKHLSIKYLSEVQNCSFGNYNTFYEHSFIEKSDFGNFVYVAPHSIVTRAKIGSFCSIGPSVQIGVGMHPVSFISTFPAFFSTKNQCQVSFTNENRFEEFGSIMIGNDVWIGANVVILDNIRIGDGAIIAAGAVVTKDVEPYTIVGGIPAKPIKKRFNDIEIKLLLDTQWWNKDMEWIIKNYEKYNNPSIFFDYIKHSNNE